MFPARILLALAISMTLVFASVAPVEATKGGKSSSGKSRSSDGDEDEGAGDEAEGDEEEGGCGSGTWIAFPLLGGIVLVKRRRSRQL